MSCRRLISNALGSWRDVLRRPGCSCTWLAKPIADTWHYQEHVVVRNLLANPRNGTLQCGLASAVRESIIFKDVIGFGKKLAHQPDLTVAQAIHRLVLVP